MFHFDSNQRLRYYFGKFCNCLNVILFKPMSHFYTPWTRNIDLRWVSEPERVKIKLTKNQELLTRIKVTSNKPQIRRSHLKWVFYKKVSPNKLIIRFWWLQGGLIQEGEKLIHNQNQETKSWDDPSLVWIVSITILILFVTVSVTRN